MNGHCDFIGRELSPINSGVTVTRKHRVLPPKVRAMPKRNKARPQLKIAPLYCPVNKDGGRLKHLENWGAAIMSRLTSWMWCRKKNRTAQKQFRQSYFHDALPMGRNISKKW
jgi:hypothetical protein